jgi:hypothetical protein
MLQVKAMSKNRSMIIFVMMIFLLAMTPTALGAAPSQSSHYQDVKWMDFFIAQSERINSDLNDINAALNANDYNKVYDGAHRLSVDEGNFLKRSKGFKVSPELKNAKQEVESAASDDVTAAKNLMTAADKQKTGDTTGQSSALKSAAYYLHSSSKHSNKASGYFNVYSGKSKTSTSNSNTGKSKTSKSNYNSNSNNPSRTNTGSGPIIANLNTNVYHNAGCRYVPTIKPEHLTYFNSRKEAEDAGYRACKVCGG